MESTKAQPDDHPESDLEFNNVPNQLTLLRIAFVPFVAGLLFWRTPESRIPTYDFFAALAFTLAAITDYFDGYIARTRKLVTVYGQLMDPLADKFLVVCSLIMLQHLGRIHPIVVMLLVCRELAITGLRALASAEGVIIAASGGGKWKTASQMVAIPFIMLNTSVFGIDLFKLGTALLYISLAMSLWSAKDYAVDFFRALREQRKQKTHIRRLARQARHKARAVRIQAREARSNLSTPAKDPIKGDT